MQCSTLQPSAKDGVVSLTSSQLACLLDGIDWRNPDLRPPAHAYFLHRCSALPSTLCHQCHFTPPVK